MKGIVFTNIIFADLLLVIPIVKVEELDTCVKQVAQFDYESNTCMVVS